MLPLYTQQEYFKHLHYIQVYIIYPFVINFDTQYTQISSDSRGNYFEIYMDGLEPERYYSILIKTEINGSTLIIEDDNYFKVING